MRAQIDEVGEGAAGRNIVRPGMTLIFQRCHFRWLLAWSMREANRLRRESRIQPTPPPATIWQCGCEESLVEWWKSRSS